MSETACRWVLVCNLACVAGCAGDTDPGDGRGLGNGITVIAPPVGSGSSAAGSGGAGSSGSSSSGSTGGVGSSGEGDSGGSSSTSGGAGTGERVFDAGSDPARNMVQAGAVCTRLSQIQCAGEAFCCENPGRTVAQCEATMRDGCADDVFLDAVTANPITSFDATKAAEAFARLEELASQCDPGIAEFGASATGLMSMLRGTLDSGRSCSPTGFDKASAAASLAACKDSATTACLPTSALVWTCRARGAAGAQCFSDLNCQEGLHCPNPSLAAGEFGTAQCAARKAEGAACMLPNECTSFACKNGLCEPPSAAAAYCLMK